MCIIVAMIMAIITALIGLLIPEGSGAILAGNVEGVPGEIHGHPILTYDIGVSRFFCDRQTSD